MYDFVIVFKIVFVTEPRRDQEPLNIIKQFADDDEQHLLSPVTAKTETARTYRIV